MAEEREFKTNIINEVFNVNDEIEVDEAQVEYLFELEDRILESFEDNGESGIQKIREEVMDDLLKNDYDDLLKYLNIDIPTTVQESIDKRFDDESLFTIEETEKSEDFFNNYLIDDVINDIIYNLKGFERKSDGAKEIFQKKRKSLIPTTRIMAIQNILIAVFNKTNFLSQKDDIEQAKIIMMAYSSVFNILLEIPYKLCDTQKTIEICGMIALKLSNLIGLSSDFRKDFLEAVKESLSSERRLKEKNSSNDND